MEKIKLKLKKKYVIALAVVGVLLVALVIGLIFVLSKPKKVNKPEEDIKQKEDYGEVKIIMLIVNQDQLL